MNEFDEFLVALKDHPGAATWQSPLIDVTDTMICGRKWFEAYHVSYSAADLIEFAKVVLAHERRKRRD